MPKPCWSKCFSILAIRSSDSCGVSKAGMNSITRGSALRARKRSQSALRQRRRIRQEDMTLSDIDGHLFGLADPDLVPRPMGARTFMVDHRFRVALDFD